MQNIDSTTLLKQAIVASLEAGKAILEIYSRNFEVDYKADESPLTEADRSAHVIIVNHIKNSGIPILSEEGKAIPYEERKQWNQLWIVDPLDGTKEFIKKNGEFTVNIALIRDGKPVLGVIYVPVKDELYFGSEDFGSRKLWEASKQKSIEDILSYGKVLPLSNSKDGFIAVGSKSHMSPETEQYFKELEKEHGRIKVLSKGSSLKICMVAEGSADIYPRFAPTMEWDVAAGHAIAKFSGATMINSETGEELTYNSQESLLNPWFIVKR